MKNNAKTLILLASLSGFLVVLGSLFGRGGAAIGLVLAAVMNIGSYWFSAKIALKMSGARPLSRAEAPELYAMVERLAGQSDLPMPTLHIIPSEQPNAFATGRNPAHAAVAVTEGILKTLTPAELEGVLAHELAHVQNRDILTTSVAATIAGSISFLATMARWGAMFGGGDDDDGGPGIVGLLVASIVAPIAALIVQMAISRSRELAADRRGAEMSHHPENLASALKRIEAGTHRVPMRVNPSASPLFIVNPLGGALKRGARLFMTHPSTEERVRRLEEMVGKV